MIMNRPNYEDITKEFLSLKQIGILDEYIVRFKELKTIIVRRILLPDEYFIECFIGGLKPHLKPYVQSIQHWNLWGAIECARKRALAMDVKHAYNQLEVIDGIGKVLKPDSLIKDNTLDIAKKLVDEMSRTSEVGDISRIVVDDVFEVRDHSLHAKLGPNVEDVFEVKDNLAQAKSGLNVGGKVTVQQEGIVKARNDIESEHETSSFTEIEPRISTLNVLDVCFPLLGSVEGSKSVQVEATSHLVRHNLDPQLVSNDYVLPTLEMVLDRIFENEMSNPIMDMEVAEVMVVDASAQKQESEFLTKTQCGVGHKIYSGNSSFCDAMIEAYWKENGHHLLDKNNQRHVCKWNGYFCSPVFYLGGVQLSVQLLAPNVHISHEARSVVFNREKLGLFLHGCVSVMVLEVIEKLEPTTMVFDPGKGNLNPTYTTQFALHFIVGTKLWPKRFHIFNLGKFESLYFTHTQPWGQGCYMEGVVWYIEKEYIILMELRMIQGGILWHLTKGCARHFNGSSTIRFYIRVVSIIFNIRDDVHQPVLDSLKVLDSMKEYQDSNEIEVLVVNGHKSRKKNEYGCFGPFEPGGTQYTVNRLAIDHGVTVNWMQVHRRCIPISCVMEWQRAWLSRFQLKFIMMKMTSYMIMRSRLIYMIMGSKVMIWTMFQFIITINSSAYTKQFFNFIPTLRARLLCERSSRVYRMVEDDTTMRHMKRAVYMIRKRDIQVNELRCCSSTTPIMRCLRFKEVFIVFKFLTQVLALLIEKEELEQELGLCSPFTILIPHITGIQKLNGLVESAQWH